METRGNHRLLETHGNPWKPHLWKHMETYGNLWTLSWKPMATVASETRGNPWTPIPWVSMDFHILWKHMETYGHLYGNPWQLLHRKLVETHGHHTNGFPWIVETYGNLLTLVWKPVETCASMESYGNLRTSMETNENIWKLYHLSRGSTASGNKWKPVVIYLGIYGNPR